MKAILTTIIICLSLLSCTDEPKETNFEVSILNNTSQDLNIDSYQNGTLISSINLTSNSYGIECSYKDENFRGLFSNECGIDSLVLKFPNNKGYIVNDNGNGNFNFSNDRNPFLPNGGFLVNNNYYKFNVTQEDYDNANDLP